MCRCGSWTTGCVPVVVAHWVFGEVAMSGSGAVALGCGHDAHHEDDRVIVWNTVVVQGSPVRLLMHRSRHRRFEPLLTSLHHEDNRVMADGISWGRWSVLG